MDVLVGVFGTIVLFWLVSVSDSYFTIVKLAHYIKVVTQVFISLFVTLHEPSMHGQLFFSHVLHFNVSVFSQTSGVEDSEHLFIRRAEDGGTRQVICLNVFLVVYTIVHGQSELIVLNELHTLNRLKFLLQKFCLLFVGRAVAFIISIKHFLKSWLFFDNFLFNLVYSHDTSDTCGSWSVEFHGPLYLTRGLENLGRVNLVLSPLLLELLFLGVKNISILHVRVRV